MTALIKPWQPEATKHCQQHCIFQYIHWFDTGVATCTVNWICNYHRGCWIHSGNHFIRRDYYGLPLQHRRWFVQSWPER